MRANPTRIITSAIVVPALALSLFIAVAAPGEVQRKTVTPPQHITALSVEQAEAPPVSGRQDGTPPPEIFR